MWGKDQTGELLVVIGPLLSHGAVEREAGPSTKGILAARCTPENGEVKRV